MLVCHCHALTDRDIRDAVARGARSAGDVERVCQAGGDCGTCRLVVERILDGVCAKQPQRAMAEHRS